MILNCPDPCFRGQYIFWGHGQSIAFRQDVCLVCWFCWYVSKVSPWNRFSKNQSLQCHRAFFAWSFGRFVYSVSRPVDMKNHLHTNRCNDRWACANNFEGQVYRLWKSHKSEALKCLIYIYISPTCWWWFQPLGLNKKTAVLGSPSSRWWECLEL